jgi:hypothetical protein
MARGRSGFALAPRFPLPAASNWLPLRSHPAA